MYKYINANTAMLSLGAKRGNWNSGRGVSISGVASGAEGVAMRSGRQK